MSQSLLEVNIPTLGGAAVQGVVRVLGGRRVLDGLDLQVPAQGRAGIVGRSGAGKSTLLSLVAGLEQADAGRIVVDGAAGPRERLARCALMPQRDCLLPWRTALDNAALALENAGLPRRGTTATRLSVSSNGRLGG